MHLRGIFTCDCVFSLSSTNRQSTLCCMGIETSTHLMQGGVFNWVKGCYPHVGHSLCASSGYWVQLSHLIWWVRENTIWIFHFHCYSESQVAAAGWEDDTAVILISPQTALMSSSTNSAIKLLKKHINSSRMKRTCAVCLMLRRLKNQQKAVKLNGYNR